jgi:hypothetical protein
MADQATAGEKIAYVVYTVGGNAVEINATETNLNNESADHLIFSNDKEQWRFWWQHVAGVHTKGKPAGVGTGHFRM